MHYDVIVAGSSFAGLAVAAQLLGKRVLLLDRHPVGTVQTSACGAPVATLRALGLDSAIQQVHDRLIVHSGRHTYAYSVAEPFCTFDYGHLCRLLRERSDAQFVRATVLGHEGGRVLTTRGAFSGNFVVDATGWRAVLAGPASAKRIAPKELNFGLETTVGYQETGLHFWYDPDTLLPFTLGWAFPCGGTARVGIGSYRGDSRLLPALDRLLRELGQRRQALHGGYFPFRLREPVVDGVFLVGDAAGQCLGLTGEGIRPALFFGTKLGLALRQALQGRASFRSVADTYRRLVARYQACYGLLDLAQRALPRLPLPVARLLLAAAVQPPVAGQILGYYGGAFALPTRQREPQGEDLHPASRVF